MIVGFMKIGSPDTTSLIKQQTELMNVISQMQPVISKGLSLVDKFHGDGKTEKLFKQYSELSKLQKSIGDSDWVGITKVDLRSYQRIRD